MAFSFHTMGQWTRSLIKFGNMWCKHKGRAYSALRPSATIWNAEVTVDNNSCSHQNRQGKAEWQGFCYICFQWLPIKTPPNCQSLANRKQRTHLDHTGMEDCSHTNSMAQQQNKTGHCHAKLSTDLQSIHDETWQQMFGRNPDGKILSRQSHKQQQPSLSFHHLWQNHRNRQSEWNLKQQPLSKQQPRRSHAKSISKSKPNLLKLTAPLLS